MKSRIRQLDSEIAQLESEKQAASDGLHGLVSAGPPIRGKATEVHDYTGHVGELKHREWDRLWVEKERVQSELRRREKEMYRLTHPDTDKRS